MDINKDVEVINEALNRLSWSSEKVGYANGSIDELLSERATTTNPDDKEAFSNLIERTSFDLNLARNAQTQARENLKSAFENYYS